MFKRTVTFAAVTALLAACNGTTEPSTSDGATVKNSPLFAAHDTPGTPGSSNCNGQTVAFIAQYYKNFGLGAPGLGGQARAAGLSVKEAQAFIDEFYCPPVEE